MSLTSKLSHKQVIRALSSSGIGRVAGYSTRVAPAKARFDPSKGNRSTSSSSEPKLKSKSKYSWKLYLFGFALGATLGLNVPLYTLLQTLLTSPLLPNEDRQDEVDLYHGTLEQKLALLPIVRKLEKDLDFIKIRAWESIDETTAESSANGLLNGGAMTSSTLRRPGGFAIKPLIFINEKTKETVSVIHVGSKLTGYPFLVHGGILATILDEAAKRCSILGFRKLSQHLKYDNESTYAHIKGENLSLSYRFPTVADSFIIVKCKCEEAGELPLDHVKVTLKVQNISGRSLVQSEAVFSNEKRRWFYFF